MFDCLLQADHSVWIVFLALLGILGQMSEVEDEESVQDLFFLLKRLLSANPAVVSHSMDSGGLLHSVAGTRISSGTICKELVSMVLSANPEALHFKTDKSELPIHAAVKACNFTAAKMLLEAYPESATMAGNRGICHSHIM